MTAAAARRFLFAFFHAHKSGSLAKSLYTLVNTVVGISLYPSARLAATCAPNCHARKGIPIKTLLLFGLFSGIVSMAIRIATTRTDNPCSRKEIESDSRRVVPNGRASAEEMREPIMKLNMAKSTPGIVGARIDDASDETAGQQREVSMMSVNGSCQVWS
ncbi:MAG: hypothetical protein Q9213_002418 [Squamulea squamosa]